MKNRMLQIIIGLFVFLMIPFKVDAATFKLNVSCTNVTVGQNVTCTLKGTVSGTQVTGFQANYTITGGTFKSFSRGTNWEGDADGGRIDLYTGNNFSGTFTIGTITIATSKTGTGRINITNIGASDYDFVEIGNIANATTTFQVKAKATTTKKKSTTTKRVSTTKKITSTTAIRTTPTTSPSTTTQVQQALTLSSVKVDEYEVSYEDGKYYATADPLDDEVVVTATAAQGITIIGAGPRSIVPGKNTVDLILRSTTGQTNTVQVIITKPDDTGVYDTTLASLKVVDYEVKYDEAKKEYTVTVPFDVKEIYVIAKGKTDNVIINGDGFHALSKGKQEINISVSYGNLSSTNYKVIIKRSYGMIFIWILIAGLAGGIGGVYFYMKKHQTAKSAQDTASANKEKAMMNRKAQAAGQSITMNGEKNAGVGRRMVAPTPVQANASASEEPKKEELAESVKVTQVVRPTPVTTEREEAPKQVVVKKAPVQVVSTAPEAQVRLVRTETSEEPKEVNTGSYNNEEIVIKDI